MNFQLLCMHMKCRTQGRSRTKFLNAEVKMFKLGRVSKFLLGKVWDTIISNGQIRPAVKHTAVMMFNTKAKLILEIRLNISN